MLYKIKPAPRDEWIDITYEGLELSVLMDDGQAIEIASSDSGQDWTGGFAPHIAGLIEDAARKALDDKRAQVLLDAASAYAEERRAA